MADSKITALTALTGAALASGDQFVAVDVSDTTMDATGTNKSMTAAELGIGLGALVALTTASNFLTADVTMTTAATYYDGPSLTPAAGTYLLLGHVVVLGVTNAFRTFQGKLWDGTTTFANDVFNVPGTAGAGQGPMSFFGVVTTAGSTTYKVSCTSSVNGDKIIHNATKGSYLYAIKIG